MDKLSAAAARRVALAAQGFGRPRTATVGTRQLALAVERLALLQIDSVNVFERSHYLPLFARLGGYDKSLLDAMTFGRRARYTEYWAHVAAFIPTGTWPLWRWYMAERRAKSLGNPDSWAVANASMLDWLRAELAAKGPLRSSEIEHDAGRRTGSWWGWSDVKLGLEYLFMWGEVVPAGRRNFERVYGLAEQVLPREILNAEVAKTDAVRELVRRSSLAHGIGTVGDLADYHRLKVEATKSALRDLVDGGEVLPVTVDGWERGGRPLPAFLHRDAAMPRRLAATALLSPFDPVVWERERALRMFDFHYRIEIYTPAAQRRFGYYTLPVLVDDTIPARIDLKSDRQRGVLRVQSAWREEGAPGGDEARIAQLLRETAEWQGLGGVEVVARGTLAPALAAELGVTPVVPAS
ncbi:hypothetical protein HNR17_002163 [Galbitalea soli]|nr:hypothetical protein [Galbitalea soli]